MHTRENHHTKIDVFRHDATIIIPLGFYYFFTRLHIDNKQNNSSSIRKKDKKSKEKRG
jgi:hypothetical protein